MPLLLLLVLELQLLERGCHCCVQEGQQGVLD
jgi:hypothetical protein